MDETPVLTRHPLQQHFTAVQIPARNMDVKIPSRLASSLNHGSIGGEQSGSDTEGMSSAGEGEEEDSGDLPMTQQIDPRPLAGLLVYVDVRSGTDGCENRSQAIAHQLDILGATVCERLTKDVTHVVFKDGKPTTKERAEKRGAYIVSPLWVDACKRSNERVSEAKYPSLSKDGCDTPVVLGKIKRIKSMQPKPLEEEITRSLERSRKRHKTDEGATLAKRKKDSAKTARSLEKDYDLSCSPCERESEERDSFELPEVDFLSKPVIENADTAVTVTPEIIKRTGRETKERKKETKRKKDADGVEIPLKPVSTNKDKKSSKVKKVAKDEPTKQHRRRSHDQENEKTGESSGEGSASKTKRRRVQFRGSPFGKKKPSLVLTSVDTKNQEVIHSVLKKLGKFEITRTVCDSTTHVVCGSPRRTINILAGTAMGCWVLSLDWIWKSLDSGYWVEEDPYEMCDHFPSAQFFRLQRQRAGLLYRPSLFASMGSVFVSSDCSPPSQQLERLLTLGGGKVSGSHRKADICVGCKSWSEDVKSVSEQWVLDSITEHRLLSLEDYVLDGPHPRAQSPEL